MSCKGAGGGGCTVSLVEESRVPEFIEKLKASYRPYHGLMGDELSEVIFATKPSSGASGAYTSQTRLPRSNSVFSVSVIIYCIYSSVNSINSDFDLKDICTYQL